MSTPPPRPLIQQLRGASRLAVDATTGLTDLVEALHGGIRRLPGSTPQARTRGITGLVYRSVRGVTALVGSGIDLALRQLEPLLSDKTTASAGSEAVLAALNGVFGDYLAASGNPLAIAMQLKAPPGPRPLLLIHGLCMNDAQWRREGAAHVDFAAGLAELGCTPWHLHYNTGLHISENGRRLAELLEQRLPYQDLTLLGHSMGGLLARSALHHAQQAGMTWPSRVSRLITLGTPHQGAPLERGGQALQQLLGLSAYSRPLVALTRRRSAGIQDLRHAALREEDWGRRSVLPLPPGIACYAVAASSAKNAEGLSAQALGDGLVPLASALGRHRQARFALDFPPERQFVLAGCSHLGLQTHPAVLAQLKAWLQ